MRRLSVIFGLFGMLAVPAAALGLPSATGDGSLVIRNGQAPAGTPVVQLVITGSVIGQVDHGRLVIDAGPNTDSAKQPQITGAQKCTVGTLRSDTAQVCGSDTFKFRAVGGRYTVLVYGTGIDLIAVGTGTVKVAGVPDMSVGDGRYSLNGGDFLSLPGTQTDQLAIKSTSTAG